MSDKRWSVEAEELAADVLDLTGSVRRLHAAAETTVADRRAATLAQVRELFTALFDLGHLAAPTSPSEPVPSTPRVLGYIVVKQYPDGAWVDEADRVHETEAKARANAATIRAEWSPRAVIAVAALVEVEETNDAD